MIETQRIKKGLYKVHCGDTYIIIKKFRGKWKTEYHDLSLHPPQIDSEEFTALQDAKVYAYDLLVEYA